MRLFAAMFMAYLIGSIPTGYLLTMHKKNIDLRAFGSGSVGATNVLRAAGKLAGFLTLMLDVFKGYVVVAILADMLWTFRMDVGYSEYIVVMALCVVCGHNWPLFLRFKGGKGIATSAGALLASSPKLLLVGLCIWLLVFVFTKIVSVSSLAASVAIPISSYFFEYPGAVRFLTIALAILTIIRHRANMRRLVKKEEKKMAVRV